MSDEPRFGVGRVTRFYVPLLLQAFSQSFVYPLAAGIVTHGASGVHALTAFNQGLMIAFMINAIGGGLVTTGMLFAKTGLGYATFRRLNAVMMAALVTLQCVPALPPFSAWVFEGFFNLPAELAEISRQTLLFSCVMNMGFFVRNVPMAVLFNNLESGKANNATALRIAATLTCAVVFPRIGWTGPAWGLAALTFGVWIETVVTWLYARPFVARLPGHPWKGGGPSASPVRMSSLLLEQFRFTMPLALGAFLLACSPLVIAAFVSRSADAADMLAVHYVTIGITAPASFCALRMQTVAVKFMPEYPGDRRLLWYAVTAGTVLGLVPLAFSTAWLGDWYFGTFQNVPPRILGTAKLAMGVYSVVGVIQAVRGRIEGIAAGRKRPRVVMWGQFAYTLSLLLVCASLLPLGCPGWTIAVSAIIVAPVCVTVVDYAVLAATQTRMKNAFPDGGPSSARFRPDAGK